MGGLLDGVDLGADLGGALADGGGGDVGESAAAAHVVFDEFGEVEARRGPAEVEDGDVVGARGGHGGRVGAQPDPRPLVWLPYLRHPLPPLPHPYPSVRLLRRHLMMMIMMIVMMIVIMYL